MTRSYGGAQVDRLEPVSARPEQSGRRQRLERAGLALIGSSQFDAGELLAREMRAAGLAVDLNRL